jgi:hypothetical protein
MSALLSVIIALVSGVTAALIGYRLNARKEHVFFVRQKLEDLYLAVERFNKMYGGYTMPYYALMNGRLTYKQVLEMQTQSTQKPDQAAAHESLTMLIDIYFPILAPELSKLEAAKSKANKIISNYKLKHDRNGPGDHGFVPPFEAALVEFENTVAGFKSAISSYAQQFADERSLLGRFGLGGKATKKIEKSGSAIASD